MSLLHIFPLVDTIPGVRGFILQEGTADKDLSDITFNLPGLNVSPSSYTFI